MINLMYDVKISSIFLTVTLLVYLLIVELGHEKTRKNLLAPVVLLLTVFAYIVIKYLYLQFTK